MFGHDVSKICAEASRVNFKGIYDYSVTSFTPTVSVTNIDLVNLYELGQQNVTGDSIANVLHSIVSSGHEHDGEVATDLELGRIVAALAKDEIGTLAPSDIVCDPAAGSGNLISAAIDSMNLQPTQILANLLCDKADDVYNGRLPIHVRCLLDEFANIGQIPQFEKLIATIRSREISASIILQSKSQLKALYRDNASTIEGNCDTTLFLGGKEKDTLKDLAEILGKETIDLYNTSDTRGTSQSYGLNYQKTGKELMSQDEIAVMDGSKCIMQLRGVRPFFSDKFDITKHKQYPLLSDYDKKNEFDIEKYVKNRNRLRFKRNDVVDEVCDVGEITA